MPLERQVSLFRNGQNQAINIPSEFELEGNKAVIHKEGDRLIIKPCKQTGLLSILSEMEPLSESLPDIYSNLESLDDIEL